MRDSAVRPCTPSPAPFRRARRPALRWPAGAALAAAVCLAALLPASAAAQEKASADAIIGQMKAALEPTKPSLRRIDMTVKQGGEQRRFTLVQARKALPDGNRSLTVMVAPDDAKGLAYLVAEKPKGQDNVEWLYIPVVRRVRQLVPAENYTSFMDTDFTYADIGFLDARTTNRLVGTEQVGDKKTYKIESIPDSRTRQWYYSRIVTWVDAATLLPLRREFYSPSKMMFKVETFDEVSRVDGVATPFKITMQNLPAGSSTELAVTDVAYGVEIPDDAFGPDKLRTIADMAFWGERHPAAK